MRDVGICWGCVRAVGICWGGVRAVGNVRCGLWEMWGREVRELWGDGHPGGGGDGGGNEGGGGEGGSEGGSEGGGDGGGGDGGGSSGGGGAGGGGGGLLGGGGEGGGGGGNEGGSFGGALGGGRGGVGGGDGNGDSCVASWRPRASSLSKVIALVPSRALVSTPRGVAASKATPNAARAANMGARSMGRPRAKSRGRFFLFFEN